MLNKHCQWQRQRKCSGRSRWAGSHLLFDYHQV